MRTSSILGAVSIVVGLAVGLAACGKNGAGGGDGVDAGGDGGVNSCSGSATRCSVNDYQVCDDGTFTTQQACASVCVDGMGCVDCDPSAGSKTCNGSDVVVCNADGSYGTTISTCSAGMMCMNASCNNTCTADGVDLVYAVDEANDFLSFDPRKLLTMPPTDPFTKIGTLSCPTTGTSLNPGLAQVLPQSMSVDRNGVGWVEYTDGEVFNVSLTDASCTATAYVPKASGMQLFGMGFSTDTMGGNTEKLFMAGGGNAAQAGGKLADIDPADSMLTPTVLGTLTATPASYSPELTGTSAAELFGFYPVISTPAYVQQIDKTSGAPVGDQFMLGSAGLGANVRDWAFAQWGGVFYVFVTTTVSGTEVSTVRAIDRATGTYSVVLSDGVMPKTLSFSHIDGAGVSTCAPNIVE